MANALNNGGGSITATTYEAAFGELANAMQTFDSGLTEPTSNITILPDVTNGVANYTITLPYTKTVVGGVPTDVADDFLSEVFDPGTGGDLASTNYPAALLELAWLMKAEETVLDVDIIDITSDESNITISIQLETTITVNVTDTYLA